MRGWRRRGEGWGGGWVKDRGGWMRGREKEG